MRKPRKLSGVFFRWRNPETNAFENVAFEDLPPDDREERMAGRDDIWLRALAHHLANALVTIGDQFDIVREDDETTSVIVSGPTETDQT